MAKEDKHIQIIHSSGTQINQVFLRYFQSEPLVNAFQVSNQFENFFNFFSIEH